MTPGSNGGPASFWNERYAQDGFLFGEQPNDFVRATARPAVGAQYAYCPADGEGRNGVHLAQLGYQVTSVDISDVAVNKARRLAEKRGVTIDCRVGSLFDFAGRDFDLVVVCFMHFRAPDEARFHRQLMKHLKPGGQLILEGYDREQAQFASGGPRDVDRLHSADALVERLTGAGFVVDLIQTVRRTLDEGPRHRGEAATVQVLARKPVKPGMGEPAKLGG